MIVKNNPVSVPSPPAPPATRPNSTTTTSNEKAAAPQPEGELHDRITTLEHQYAMLRKELQEISKIVIAKGPEPGALRSPPSNGWQWNLSSLFRYLWPFKAETSSRNKLVLTFPKPGLDRARKQLDARVSQSELKDLDAFEHLDWPTKPRFGEQSASLELLPPIECPEGTSLVTVIVPCFNHGKFVADAVQSLLDQTFDNLEVIVVDGGSTDGVTPASVSALAGPRVRALLRTGGRYLPGDNRNYGIAATDSPYVCCLDADDILDPTYIEKVLFYLEYRGYDVGSSSLQQFGNGATMWRLQSKPTLNDFKLENNTLVCAVFRRVLWGRTGGYRDSGLGRNHVPEDWDLWLRFAAIGARFRNIRDEALLNYRVHAGFQSVSTHKDTPSLDEQRRMLLDRNGDALDPVAAELSARQALRKFRPRAHQTAMLRSMQRQSVMKRKPTLLLAIPYFLIGGAERLLSGVVKGLIDAGWRVTVVSTLPQDSISGDSIQWFKDSTPECYALPRFLSADDWDEFVQYLLESRTPDALLIAGSHYFYDLLPRIAVEFPHMARLDLLFNTVGHVAKHMEKREWLTGALCESEVVNDWFQTAAKWTTNEIRCIPSGVDTNVYMPNENSAQLRTKLGITAGDIVVGWSGRFSEEKSPEVFIQLAARCHDLSNVHFVMTGGGHLDNAVTDLIASLPSAKRFHRVGIVDDVRPYYQMYDIFVLTSQLDGRPMALLEAQASGCAIIASRIGGVPDIVESNVAGLLVAPANCLEFEAALRKLAESPKYLAQMRKAARANAVDKYSMASMIAGYESALSYFVSSTRNTQCKGK